MAKKLTPTAVTPEELAEMLEAWGRHGVKFNIENLILKSFTAPHQIGVELLEDIVHDEHTSEWRWGSVYYSVIDAFGNFYGVSYRTQPEEGITDDGDMEFSLVEQRERTLVVYEWVDPFQED